MLVYPDACRGGLTAFPAFGREAFEEEIAAGYLKKFPELVRGALENARSVDEGLGAKGALSLVVLTGGHSQWYFVQSMVEQLTGGAAQYAMARVQETVGFGLTVKPVSDPIPSQVPAPTYGPHLVTTTRMSIRPMISAGTKYLVGPTAGDGTVLATDGDIRKKVEEWTDIAYVDCAGKSVIGVRTDGTVVSTNQDWLKGTKDWEDIVQVVAYDDSDFQGSIWIYGLRSNGTVLMHVKDDGKYSKPDFSRIRRTAIATWADIIKIAPRSKRISDYMVGLKRDGTVVSSEGSFRIGWKSQDILNFRGIADIDVSYGNVVGLRRDGTVVVAGKEPLGESKVRSVA